QILPPSFAAKSKISAAARLGGRVSVMTELSEILQCGQDAGGDLFGIRHRKMRPTRQAEAGGANRLGHGEGEMTKFLCIGPAFVVWNGVMQRRRHAHRL